VEAHSRAIAALLDDEAKRSAIAKAAKARANERFSTDTIVSKYEDLYRRIKK
jgi:glycosyltransferase involved in cell wall biosynthesis